MCVVRRVIQECGSLSYIDHFNNYHLIEVANMLSRQMLQGAGKRSVCVCVCVSVRYGVMNDVPWANPVWYTDTVQAVI